MTAAKQLYQLQEIDSKLESTDQSLKKMTAQLGENAEVVKAESDLAAQKQQLDELKKQQRAHEWEIDDLATKINAAEKKLYDGSIRNPKELANLQADVKLLKAKRSQLEDKVLELMDQIERGEGAVKAKSAVVETLKTSWQREQQRMSAEIDQLKGVMANLQNERQQAAVRIPTDTLDFYQRLRQQKRQAVAKVEQGMCSGCRITLSIIEAQRTRGDSLVQCSSCGRILFLP